MQSRSSPDHRVVFVFAAAYLSFNSAWRAVRSVNGWYYLFDLAFFLLLFVHAVVVVLRHAVWISMWSCRLKQKWCRLSCRWDVTKCSLGDVTKCRCFPLKYTWIDVSSVSKFTALISNTTLHLPLLFEKLYIHSLSLPYTQYWQTQINVNNTRSS